MSQNTIPVIRVFLSSPGDVNSERKHAISHMEWLANFRPYRNRFHLQIIAWDDPKYSTTMRATLSPQEAINRGLPRPSQCDIVIVLFWSRMGTPFTDVDGQEYMSGTHWELLDAFKSKTTATIIYRCTKERLFKESDEDGRAQVRKVSEFFSSDFFYQDGKAKSARHEYASMKEFEALFEEHFVQLIEDILKSKEKTETIFERTQLEQAQNGGQVVQSENIHTITPIIWDDSPFPGLRSYTLADEPIFFGRTREIDELVQEVAKSRFVAVVGASGSGKSSLVAAGLIPRLKANAILETESGVSTVSSQNWQYAFMKPGEDPENRTNPFASLYNALVGGDKDKIAFPHLKLPQIKQNIDKKAFLANVPESIFEKVNEGLKNVENGELCLFIDQFEELFTLNNQDDRLKFIDFLLLATQHPKLRIVVTMRSDFFPECLEVPDLSRLINAGSYTVSVPKRDALETMIIRPAEIAGLKFEDDLVKQILDDTLGDQGTTPGALALMAYTLDELYKKVMEKGTDTITFQDYDELGRVQGAIAKRAEDAFSQLEGDPEYNQKLLERGFYNLATVSDDGTPTRKRWDVNPADLSHDQFRLIKAFVDASLLVEDAKPGSPTVVLEVAHEALFTNWGRLQNWIGDVQNDYILLRQLRFAAHEWHKRNRNDNFLWTPEQLRAVYKLPDDMKKKHFDLVIEQFINIFDRWTDTLIKQETDSRSRMRLGDNMIRLESPREGVGLIADSEIPDIQWGDATIKWENSTTAIGIARYPITVWQFEAFYKATNEFRDSHWWDGLPQHDKEWENLVSYGNRPATYVTWTAAVAFCRWMTQCRWENRLFEQDKFPEEFVVRLPTMDEWLWGATAGYKRRYPWGDEDWQDYLANLKRSNLNDAIAVGMYPLGNSPLGLYDMLGNVNEWCRDLFVDPQDLRLSVNDRRVTMGGSFLDFPQSLEQSRDRANPNTVARNIGFRPILARPLTDEDLPK